MSGYEEFRVRFRAEQADAWRGIYRRHQDVIRIKKEKFALPSLERIITSAIELSNRHGFRAMSLRDLSEASGVSMGALYSYIESKERLLTMILGQVLHVVESVLGTPERERAGPAEQLRWLLRNHVFLTEAMQPWFYFAYMEAKSFDRAGKRTAIESELRTEELIAACLRDGEAEGVFRPVDPVMTASLIKPLLQDWYLKRWKYRRRGVTPDAYAERVIAFVESFVTLPRSPGAARPPLPLALGDPAARPH